MMISSTILHLIALALISGKCARSSIVLSESSLDALDGTTSSPPSPPITELEGAESSLTKRDVGRCHKGYCWQWCLNDPNLKFWCYTTKGSSMDGGYVKCNYPYECQHAQKCGGPCGL